MWWLGHQASHGASPLAVSGPGFSLEKVIAGMLVLGLFEVTCPSGASNWKNCRNIRPGGHLGCDCKDLKLMGRTILESSITGSIIIWLIALFYKSFNFEMIVVQTQSLLHLAALTSVCLTCGQSKQVRHLRIRHGHSHPFDTVTALPDGRNHPACSNSWFGSVAKLTRFCLMQ